MCSDVTCQCVIVLMEEILHQLIGSVSHYFQGFIHPRWCRISSINSSVPLSLFRVCTASMLCASPKSLFSPPPPHHHWSRSQQCSVYGWSDVSPAGQPCYVKAETLDRAWRKLETQLDLHLEFIRLPIQQKSPSECNKHLCITSSYILPYRFSRIEWVHAFEERRPWSQVGFL